MSPNLTPWLILWLACLPGWGQGFTPRTPAGGETLVRELGCGQCHTDLPTSALLRQQSPDLGHAGLRYRPAHLYDFLLQPQAVRRHIGRARMPSFQLTEAEAIALTAYLGTLRQRTPSDGPGVPWPDLPPSIRTLTDQPLPAASPLEFEGALADGLICLTCHTVRGRGGQVAAAFETIARRVQPAWIVHYLVAPQQFGVPPAVMPSQFYDLPADRRSFQPLRPDADRKIAVIAGFLGSLGDTVSADLESRYANARAKYPKADANAGEQLFRALNCAACHRHPTVGARTNAAPELVSEGLRVQPTWLADYLRKPHAIRPAGYQPGDGSRMPDYALNNDEVSALTTYLQEQRKPLPLPPGIVLSNQPPSAFSRAKTQALLETKLSCLGCHALAGQGGRIGPDLATTAARLQPAYVHGIIADPARLAPHAGMPKLPLSAATADLLARHLLHGGWKTAAPASYLSPLDHPSLLTWQRIQPGVSPIHARYLRHCAACHGLTGRGDGYNAAWLRPVQPAVFNAATLSKRPDDTLFDGIHSGGAILGRSHWMPAWGETLNAREIRELVRYLRELCGCEGPAWARDGKPVSVKP